MVGLPNVFRVLPKTITITVRIAFIGISDKDLYVIDHGFHLFESDPVSIVEGHEP
jgi:hypothetical protein